MWNRKSNFHFLRKCLLIHKTQKKRYSAISRLCKHHRTELFCCTKNNQNGKNKWKVLYNHFTLIKITLMVLKWLQSIFLTKLIHSKQRETNLNFIKIIVLQEIHPILMLAKYSKTYTKLPKDVNSWR